jgi:ATP synthase protein I
MESDKQDDEHSFIRKIDDKEKRKIKAGKENKSAWSGLSMFGMVGWSVVVPALLGAALGIKLDKVYHQPYSWTLTLLITGLFIGCLIAWHWVSEARKDE